MLVKEVGGEHWSSELPDVGAEQAERLGYQQHREGMRQVGQGSDSRWVSSGGRPSSV